MPLCSPILLPLPHALVRFALSFLIGKKNVYLMLIYSSSFTLCITSSVKVVLFLKYECLAIVPTLKNCRQTIRYVNDGSKENTTVHTHL